MMILEGTKVSSSALDLNTKSYGSHFLLYLTEQYKIVKYIKHRTTIGYHNMVSVILLIVRLTGEAILWEKANVKEAVAVLGREDRMYKIHAVLQGKWSSVLVS